MKRIWGGVRPPAFKESLCRLFDQDWIMAIFAYNL
jgi:hypothetical protein